MLSFIIFKLVDVLLQFLAGLHMRKPGLVWLMSGGGRAGEIFVTDFQQLLITVS
jgi:hypothetical protein